MLHAGKAAPPAFVPLTFLGPVVSAQEVVDEMASDPAHARALPAAARGLRDALAPIAAAADAAGGQVATTDTISGVRTAVKDLEAKVHLGFFFLPLQQPLAALALRLVYLGGLSSSLP